MPAATREPRTTRTATNVPDGVVDPTAEDRNEVVLVGRLSAPPEERELPSGDRVVELRVVVRRPDGSRVDSLSVVVGPPPAPRGRRAPGQAGRQDVRRAASFAVDDRVEVRGWVQRRFWAAPGGRRTRLQIVATTIAKR